MHRATLFDILHDGLESAGVALRTGVEVASVEHGAAPVLVDTAGARHGPATGRRDPLSPPTHVRAAGIPYAHHPRSPQGP